MANILSIIRIVSLSAALLFAIIALGLAADITNTTEGLPIDSFYFIFAVLAIATGVLTVMSLPVLLVTDFVRTGAFTSMVVVELVWLTILWILWLSTGSDAASTNNRYFPDGCGFINQVVDKTCREFSGVVAFSFLTWIVLFAYTITLFVFVLIGQSKGHTAWTTSVKQSNFLAPAAGGVQTGGYPETTAPQMTNQYQYPPTGVPASSPQQYQQNYAAAGYSQPTATPPPQGYPQSPGFNPQQPQGYVPQPAPGQYPQV